MINRSAIVVIPKQPFLDWLHRIDSTGKDITLADLANEPSIYLLSECETPNDLIRTLRKVCEEIFVDQLDGWYRAPELWPKDRSLEVFRVWFDYSFHSILKDLAESPIRRYSD